jgi:hypothetical protein
MAGPFGRALRDHYRGERTAPLVERAGSERREHPVEQFYFGTFPEDGCDAAWLQSWLAGPLVDVGAEWANTRCTSSSGSRQSR